MKRNLRKSLIFGQIAVVALALIGASFVSAGSDPYENVKIEKKGKIKIVEIDEDGSRHEEVFEFDGDNPRPFLGVLVDRASEGGALVEKVIGDSGAERAGLQKGDIVVGFNGDEIEKPWDLTKRILSAEIGDRVDLDVIRDGERQTLTAELGEREGSFSFGFDSGEWHEQLREHLGDMDFDFDLPGIKHLRLRMGAQRPMLGVQLVQPTAELREHLGGSEDAGVLVGKVLPGMPAEEVDIRVGDLIVAADGTPVENAGDLIDALRGKDGESLELDLIRNGQPMTLDVFIPEQDEGKKILGPRA